MEQSFLTEMDAKSSERPERPGIELNVTSWQTKPSDRFILKWIKVHLSARITPHLVAWPGLEPWMITLFSSAIGVLAGILVAMGAPVTGGLVAALAQVLDGVDGQFARITGRQSKGGAFWDSVLDRYTDGAMVIGLCVYLLRFPQPLPPWCLILLGSLAVIGSNLISYSSSRGEHLGIDLGPPTLASKGTRMSVMILSCWGAMIWTSAPLLAVLHLVVHTQAAIIQRLRRALKAPQPL
ncbi:MAG: CDP-alcohol phosphatidyltransferase family protein [Syntrophobacteraceae bacterium]|nr:CDP-alcohol phosphatidyltransferase family protein [Syntrophobacteraceae bacterium]